MAVYDEWSATIRNVEFSNNLQIIYRVVGSSLFFAILLASLYFPLLTTPLLAFDIVFISLVWVIDRRISAVSRAVFRRGLEIEKTYMKSRGVFHSIKSVKVGWLMRNIVSLYYTVLVAFGFVFAWHNMVIRHSSFLDVFYAAAVVYILVYIYWLKEVKKIESA